MKKQKENKIEKELKELKKTQNYCRKEGSIWKSIPDKSEILLVRTGSHSDLFK